MRYGLSYAMPKTMMQVKSWETSQRDKGWSGTLSGLHWDTKDEKVHEWWLWKDDKGKQRGNKVVKKKPSGKAPGN